VKRLIVVLCISVLAACGSSTPKDIKASDAWARFTPVNAAVYVTIKNTTSDADTLTAASVPPNIADKAELHQTTTSSGDLMGMVMEATIDIPAKFTLSMNPGGYHIMLTGTHGAPPVGSTFPLTLTFSHHAPITQDVEVRA
jgi:periplasmic copper chaperone A